MIAPLAQGFSDSRRAKLTSERQQVAFHIQLVMIYILIGHDCLLITVGEGGCKVSEIRNMSDEGY